MTRLSGWPALVLTAGLGSRLHPLSLVRAKAALPIAGEVLIGRILRRLRDSGIQRVVLNLHHLPETITREVGDGSRFGIRVRYSWESTVLGSAGGPARAIPLLEADRFLVINGDTIAEVDLEDLASKHVTTGALVTMAVVAGDPHYGGVVADRESVVQGFVPPSLASKGPAPGAPGALGALGTYHFVGAQAVNASAFSGVSPDRPMETVRELYPRLIAQNRGSVRAYSTDVEFLDIGTPGGYLHTASRVAVREGKPLDCGERCTLAQDARVERTILWNDVTVEPHASLTECIVADGVTVPAGMSFHRCSLVTLNSKMIAEPF
ncbi:MAG: sugar phosphate nucleotidyltransferase [Vicinamibacterales bacterium]